MGKSNIKQEIIDHATELLIVIIALATALFVVKFLGIDPKYINIVFAIVLVYVPTLIIYYYVFVHENQGKRVRKKVFSIFFLILTTLFIVTYFLGAVHIAVLEPNSQRWLAGGIVAIEAIILFLIYWKIDSKLP